MIGGRLNVALLPAADLDWGGAPAVVDLAAVAEDCIGVPASGGAVVDVGAAGTGEAGVGVVEALA